jgi:YbbR domain-containing protein
VNWITDSWRLKLLAFGLAVLMLGAVAFSQNPPTSRTFQQVPIVYTGTGQGAVPPDLIIINPPTTTKVTITGLADTISSVTTGSIVATFDFTKVAPGPSVKVNLIVKSLIPGVGIQDPIVPFALNIDKRLAKQLTVQVRTPRLTPGWQVTVSEARCPVAPCVVTFTGPASLTTNLNAYADFLQPVANTSNDILTQPVVMVQNDSVLDLSKLKTEPQSTLDITTVAIHVEAKTGTSSRQVVLVDAPPTKGPPPGYRVTDIKIDPLAVVISGPADALGKITTITLPPFDLSTYTSNASFTVTIPYPSGITGALANARITYFISANPNAQPTPTGTPSP